MRNTILGALLLSATIIFAATYQPLNVKPGLWHVTGTNQFMGRPMKTDYNKCITAKDLNSNPWTNGPDEKCEWSVVTATGSDMEIKGTSCDLGKEYGMTTNVDLKLHAVDTQNVTATLQGTSTGNGQTMNLSSNFTGKWLAEKCPSGTN